MTRGLAIVAVCLGVLGAFTSAAGPDPRMDLTTFSASPQKVAALKRGVQAMKSRKPSDPKSWFYQAAIHAVTPEAIADALELDPDVAKVDQARFWNQCPHFGQPSADFLIWHRAYLFYFERILREASDDPSLSLPYWNYTAANRQFPALFGDPDLHPVTRQARNPLFSWRRELALTLPNSELELSERAVSTGRALAETSFFGVSEAEGFAGGVADTNPGTKGLAEQRPHDSIHFAVGGAIDSAGGEMSSVQTAAFDPIFWVHHANIDRLWAQWECQANRVWGAVPPDAWLNDKPWSFNDVSSIESRSRLDYLTYSTLNIHYDSDLPACKRLSSTPPRPINDPDVSRMPQVFSPGRQIDIGQVDKAVVITPQAPVSRTVPLTTGPVLDHVSLRAAVAEPRSRVRVFLELRGVDYAQVPSSGYEVYVNLPAGRAPDPDGPFFVGTLALFGLKHGDHAADSVQSFDVTSRVPTDQPASLLVTIVPFNLLQSRGATDVPVRTSAVVTIRSMAVVVVEGK